MLFPTVEFACFFLLVFWMSWAAHGYNMARKVLLVGASYFFYSYWDWRFAFLLFECSMINWLLGLWIEGATAPRRKKQILVGGLIFNLGVLGFFKYCGFFLSSFNDLLLALGLERDMKVMSVLLPVGVSFFTFQGISYVVDVYRGDMKPTTSALDMLLLVSFFPHLVAGPLVRASELLPQFEKPVDASEIRAGRALLLIGGGLFKKVVIAHYLAVELVNPIFEAPGNYGTLDLLLGAYGYAVQIYCDFSAYSDIAIGLALLLGYRFPRNFNQPYRADSLRDFWHRWHISLSSWLRDYLFIPLGGSRSGELKTHRNLILTMLLGGLWHGASWTFVVWGFLHGVGLSAERYLRSRTKFSIPSFVKVALVFHFVCLCWIFFNCESTALAFEYVGAIFSGLGVPMKIASTFTVTLLLLGFFGQFLPEDVMERIEVNLARVPLPLQAAGLGFAVVLISAMSPGALAPFIYFRF